MGLISNFLKLGLLANIYVLVMGVRVCKNFISYDNPHSPDCFDNPDAESNATEIVRRHGFKAEEYNIETEDGYTIFVLRVYSKISRKEPLVVGHSVTQPITSWVNRGDKSLAFFFAQKGFDVWLISFRGSLYSTTHRSLSVDDPKFWEFSFDEMGICDLKAVLHLTKTVTGAKAIYVGYGLGAAVGAAYATRKAEDSKDKLCGIVCLAPIIYIHNMKSLSQPVLWTMPLIKSYVIMKYHGVLEVPNKFFEEYCSRYAYQMYICQTFKSWFYGENLDQLDPLTLPVNEVMNHDKSSIYLKEHLFQIQRTNKFRERDLGREGNIKKCGQPEPKIYNLSDIIVPVTIYGGEKDWISTRPNVERVYTELSPEAKCGLVFVNCKKWNHRNFIDAKDVVPLLYEPLHKGIVQMAEGKCP